MKEQQNIFDPGNIDQRIKKSTMNQTIYNTKLGLYKNFPNMKSNSFSYMSNFSPGVPNNICDVQIVHEHMLDAAEKYSQKGTQNYSNTSYPVIINMVGPEFSGTNMELSENMRDEIINLRTTFCGSCSLGDYYPVKKNECVYNKLITVIRPKTVNTFLPYNNTYKVALITVCPINCEELLSENKMTSTDYANTCTTIECIFQAAVAGNHKILILPPFGHECENNPVGDIIRIYNYYIFKYSHLFSKIIIAIPPHHPSTIFREYRNDIICPFKLVTDVDKKYEQDMMKENLMKNSAISSRTNMENIQHISENDEQDENITQMPQHEKEHNENITQTNQQDQQIDPEQMKMFMQMMNNYNKQNL
jgi:hypothetical protein